MLPACPPLLVPVQRTQCLSINKQCVAEKTTTRNEDSKSFGYYRKAYNWASQRWFVFWCFVFSMTSLLSPPVSEEVHWTCPFPILCLWHFQSFCLFITFSTLGFCKQPSLCFLAPSTPLLIAQLWFYALFLFSTLKFLRKENLIALPNQHRPFLDKALVSNGLIHLWITHVFTGLSLITSSRK